MNGSLADCLAALAAGKLGYSRDHRRKLRNYIRRGIRAIYSITNDKELETLLADIPATLEAFDAKWLRGRRLPAQFANFGSAKVYKDARRDCRRLIAVFTGEAKTREDERALKDGWHELDATIRGAISDGRVTLHEKKLTALRALQRNARRARLHPHWISHDWLIQVVSKCDLASEKRSLQRAAKLLDSMRGQPDVVPPDLLPKEPLGQIHVIVKTRHKRTRPASLTAPMEIWLAERQEGPTKGYQRKKGRGIKEQTVVNYRSGCLWYIDGLIELGKIDPLQAPAPADIARLDWLDECVGAEIEALFPWRPLQPAGLLGYLSGAAQWLKQYDGNLTKAIATIMTNHRFFDDVNLISKKRRAWCKGFISDIELQVKFFDMPLTFQRMAEPLLANYAEIGPVRQAQAIKFAVAAAMAAILTSLPLRSGSLDALTIIGPEPHIRLKGGVDHDVLWIFLPAEFVKNNEDIEHPIRPKPPVNPRQIIEWFIEKARGRLLENHISEDKADDLKLFCGIGYARLHHCWDFATTEAGLPMTQHLARHAIASWLYNRDRKSVDLIAALLSIEADTVIRNYAFADKQKLARESDDLMASEIAILRKGAEKFQHNRRGFN